MSSTIERHGASPFAPKAGADLHAARERVGWSLHDISSALRIRLQYLEALEAGRIADLPGNAYALGFLRTYASALGLDPNEIARRFKAEAATVNQKTELTFPVPVPERGVPAGAIVFLGVLLAIGAYAGWYRLSGEGALPAETTVQIPERLAPLAEQALPPAPAMAQTAAAPVEASPRIQEAEAPPPPAISPTSAAAAAAPVPAPTTLTAFPDQPRIVLRATADAWVQVRDRAGPVLLNRILHAGETWDVPAKANLLLTTGNAGGTDLVVDGVSTASLGGNGVVRRDLPLDPDLIKDGKFTAANLLTGGNRPGPQ